MPRLFEFRHILSGLPLISETAAEKPRLRLVEG